jgi:hypothetical protein
MRNLIEESKVKSTRMFRGDVPMFDMVNVKFEEDGRVYMYNIQRSENEDVNHYICCTSFEQDEYGTAFSWNSNTRTKLYTDSAKFEAALKRIQSIFKRRGVQPKMS